MIGALADAVVALPWLVAEEAAADPRWNLSRAHIDALRRAGYPRAQVVALVAEVGGQALADVIADDLDVYGEWADG